MIDRPENCVCDFYNKIHRDFCPVFEEQLMEEMELDQKLDRLFNVYCYECRDAYGRWSVNPDCSEEEFENSQPTFQEWLERNDGT